MEFCKQFNARTQEKKGQVLPVLISIYSDKSYDFVVKTPPAAVLLLEASKKKKASPQSNRQKVGTVTWDQVKNIAETKMQDLNAFTVESAMKMMDIVLDERAARRTVQVRPADTRYAALRVIVVDPDGAPIENAYVSLMHNPGNIFLGSVPTNEEGIAEVEAPIMGSAEVSVYGSGFGVARANVRVAEGAELRVTMQPLRDQEKLAIESFFPESTTFVLHEKISIRALLGWLAAVSDGHVVLDDSLKHAPQFDRTRLGPMPYPIPVKSLLNMLQSMYRIAAESSGDSLRLYLPDKQQGGPGPR